MKKIVIILLGMLPAMVFAKCAYFIPTDFHNMQYGLYGYMYHEDGKRCTSRKVYFRLEGIKYDSLSKKEMTMLMDTRWKLGTYKSANGGYEGVLLDDMCGASINEKIIRDRKWAKNY